jgi:hypothetical protein
LWCFSLLVSSSQTPPQFSMAGKNGSARYSCLTNKSWALATKKKIFGKGGRNEGDGAWSMKKIEQQRLSATAGEPVAKKNKG